MSFTVLTSAGRHVLPIREYGSRRAAQRAAAELRTVFEGCKAAPMPTCQTALLWRPA